MPRLMQFWAGECGPFSVERTHNILTRQTASRNMYSLTFCVRAMLSAWHVHQLQIRPIMHN